MKDPVFTLTAQVFMNLYNTILFCVVSFGSTLPLEMIPISEEQYSVAAGQSVNISSIKLFFLMQVGMLETSRSCLVPNTVTLFRLTNLSLLISLFLI